MRRKMSRERMSSDCSVGSSTGFVIVRLRHQDIDRPAREHNGHDACGRKRGLPVFLCHAAGRRLKAGQEPIPNLRKSLNASIQAPVRRNARHFLRAQRVETCRGLVPGEVRRHACAVHGEPGRESAGLDAQFRQGLGDGGIRHAAALDRRAHAPRGLVRQAGRPHAGDPAADRAQPQGRGRSRLRWASSRSPSTAT